MLIFYLICYLICICAKRVPKPAHPRPQPSEETQRKEVVEITPIEPPPTVNPKANPQPQPAYQVSDFRAVTMDQQIQARAEELAREIIKRGEFGHTGEGGLGDDGEEQRRG